MKLRLHVVILTMALLVAGAGSASAFPLDPPAEPVVPGPGAPGCAVQAAPGPVAPPAAEDGEFSWATIPLDMVCPPPPAGQYWYDSSTPVGRIRVGRPRLGGRLGTPPDAVYRVEVPFMVELDDGGSIGLDVSLEERDGNGRDLYPINARNRSGFFVPSQAFHRPGTPLRLMFFGPGAGSETVYNPRTGQYSVRTIVGETANGGRILLPQVTVAIDLTVPGP
jgi:hypothetical protein